MDLVVFAVAERNRGARWQDIRQAIKERFQIEPPTERIMLEWHKHYGTKQPALDAAMSAALAEMAKKAVSVAAQRSYELFVAQGLPAFKEYCEQGMDAQVASVVVVLAMVEQQFGSEVFQRAVREFDLVREKHRKAQKPD